jgi:predicted aspartyl protease
MRTRVGKFRYPVEIGDASGERFVELRPLVDTGALYSQFADSLLRSLGHEPDAVRQFRLADGSVVERPIGEVPLRIRGEIRTSVCIFAPEGSEELLGAFTMEAFSLAPDPVNETLVPVIAMLA